MYPFIYTFIHPFIQTDRVECDVPTPMSEPSYLTLPQVYRVAAAAPFTPFDTMYIDSQHSGTKETSHVCVDFPRLTSPRLASHLQLQLKLQSTMCYNSAEQSRTECVIIVCMYSLLVC